MQSRQPENFVKPTTDGASAANRQRTKHLRQPEKTKPLGIEPNGFLLDRLAFRLPNPTRLFDAAALPLRPAERSILFSGKSVRLSDDAHSAASSHAPKKGCAVREVCEADLHVGVAFLLPEPIFVICASGFCIRVQ